MAQIIKIKSSITPGNVPASLQTGELAINVTDGSLFFGSATTVYNSFKFGGLDIADDLTVGNDISLVDNGQILLGNGDDLKIYHSGSHSIIQDTGTGNLELKGSIVKIRGTAGGDNALIYTENAGVELYYDNVKKFETTTDGVTMAGEIDMAASKITGLAEPTADEDAATKSYVDSQTHTDGTVTSVGTTGTVNGITLTGGDITSTGTITLGGTLGSIANSQLTNSTVSLGGVTLSLGDMDTSPAFNLADAHSYLGDTDLVTTGTITNGTWNDERLFTPIEEEICGHMGDYVIFGEAGATECGLVYYYNGSAWELANAGAVSTSSGLLAIAMGTANTKGMMLRGMFGPVPTDPGDSGDVLYLSETDGELTNTAPTTSEAVVRVVGYALSDEAPGLWFNPDNTWVELS